MRTKVKPADYDESDWMEKECPYLLCPKPTFYTDNISAEYCCDSHRGKQNKIKHKPENDLLKRENKQFKTNSAGLEKLYLKKIINPTTKDLRIVDFNLSIRKREVKIGEDTGFEYFDYVLVIKKDNSFEIIKTKK